MGEARGERREARGERVYRARDVLHVVIPTEEESVLFVMPSLSRHLVLCTVE
jgi:hypothetical protein